MNIYIDYEGNTPSPDVESKLDEIKKAVINALKPIEEELNKSNGMIKIKCDGTYEIDATPLIVTKVSNLLDPWS